MTRPARGAIFLISFAILAGCTPVLTQRQALNYATARLNRFCTESGPCEPRQISGAQRLKQGWLIDFDAASARYGVMVHDNRVTEVSVWKKSVPAAPGG
jgi:hypothetical protein